MKSREQMEHDADPDNYPPHLAHLAPTDADLEIAMEETTGKPTKPESAQAGIDAMDQRILDLQIEKAKLLDQQNLAVCAGQDLATLKSHIADVDRQIVTAVERRTHYQFQLDKTN